jgi:hypothetical protein
MNVAYESEHLENVIFYLFYEIVKRVERRKTPKKSEENFHRLVSPIQGQQMNFLFLRIVLNFNLTQK